jgi:DnaJ-class molecular chaperone
VAALIVVAAVFAVGYLLSIRLHPFTNCRACKGGSRQRGAIYRHGYRTCRRCKGSGRKLRFGAQLRGPNQ